VDGIGETREMPPPLLPVARMISSTPFNPSHTAGEETRVLPEMVRNSGNI